VNIIYFGKICNTTNTDTKRKVYNYLKYYKYIKWISFFYIGEKNVFEGAGYFGVFS
jgi:hypothetical protein